jgi:phosphohistidine phosphatase SixA/8-oxo-dGTP pyrophosphatase MutT (NUDIX family)
MADQVSDDTVRAAGAVVWREPDHEPEIVIVHRPKYDDWSFPKGKSECGEHVLRTATREVAEETGSRVVLGRRLTSSEYWVGDRVKHVSYWAARCVQLAGFVPGHEVDELAWLRADQVRERLSYERDVTLLDEFTSGPASSVPFILLRHAEAGVKSQADPLDLARPLDAQGAAEADLLAELLASYGRCRVLSSAAERCVATVRPYAAAIGTQVEIEPAFTVPGPAGAGSDGTAVAARRVADLVAAGEPTLLCAHGENLPVMTAAARAVLKANPVKADSPLPKGTFLVLQLSDGALVSAERHDLVRLRNVVAMRYKSADAVARRTRTTKHERIKAWPTTCPRQ